MEATKRYNQANLKEFRYVPFCVTLVDCKNNTTVDAAAIKLFQWTALVKIALKHKSRH